MENRGVKKTAGHSSVVVDGVIHNFFISSDKCHPGWVDIRPIFNCLKNEMKLGDDFTQVLDTC